MNIGPTHGSQPTMMNEGEGSPKRPWQAVVVGVLAALNTLQFFWVGFASRGKIVITSDLDVVDGDSVAKVAFVIGAIWLLLTIGLFRRSNAAWALVTVGALIGIIRALSSPIALVIQIALLVMLLMPATTAFYRRKDGRANTSVSKRFIVTLAICAPLAILAAIALLNYVIRDIP